jgi:hypothetical protein
MPLTLSITEGISFGFIAYVLPSSRPGRAAGPRIVPSSDCSSCAISSHEHAISDQKDRPDQVPRRGGGAILLAALFLANCAAVPPPATAPRFAPPDAAWVARTLRKMTVEEKIGQMIACRFTAEFRNADSPYLRELEALVADSKIGGLILFAPARVYDAAELANRFQSLAKVPLLMAADFEAGAANRVTGATLFPPLMSLGAAGSEDLARAMGRITALEGRAMGIHDLRPGRRRQHQS